MEYFYPKTLEGIYEVDFSTLRLEPKILPIENSKIREIWFDDKFLAKVIFDDDHAQLLTTWYDKYDNIHHFIYEGICHTFQVKIISGKINRNVNIEVLRDFNGGYLSL